LRQFECELSHLIGDTLPDESDIAGAMDRPLQPAVLVVAKW
jgi:hypothetical protein